MRRVDWTSLPKSCHIAEVRGKLRFGILASIYPPSLRLLSRGALFPAAASQSSSQTLIGPTTHRERSFLRESSRDRRDERSRTRRRHWRSGRSDHARISVWNREFRASLVPSTSLEPQRPPRQRQQAGRAGRRARDSLAVLVADNLPIDQHYVQHPDDLFTKPMSDLMVDLDSKVILEAHLQCAAHEMPLCKDDDVYFGPSLGELCDAKLSRDKDGW